MSDKVLFVDDEPAVLDGYQRLLGREISLHTAVGGLAGLDAIADSGPYGLVISDMRMPDLDGPHFLARVREIEPATVRVAITGYVDIDAAIYAVNEGHIFRFLTKPCSRENLRKAIDAGLEQHRLLLAEKELLEGTLRGCVLVMSEMLSFTNPAAFGRAMRLRRLMQHATARLQLKSSWQLEIAAILSQLGCVTLNQDLVNAAYAGERLSPEDQKKYDLHAMVASQMLSRIPRMEAVAQMIALQNAPAAEIKAANADEKREIETGVQLLRVGLAYDALINRGIPPTEACRRVRATMKGVEAFILDALDDLEMAVPLCTRECGIRELAVGMILHQDVHSSTGLLIVAKGQELTSSWIARLTEYARHGTIPGRLHVLMPQAAPPESHLHPIGLRTA
jgi:CheY-like chemotaxis protein